MMLMCSIAYAQAPKNKKQTKPRKSKTEKSVTPAKPQSLVIDSVTFTGDSISFFDPMDTVQLVKSKSALDARVKYYARDSMPYYANEKTIYMYGNAKVTYEDMELTAEFMRIQLDKNLVIAQGVKDSNGNWVGKPFFKQGNTDYRADIIKYNYKTKRGYLSELRTKEGEGYIHGSDVVKNEENTMGVQKAKYTTCELEHPHYYIGATRIKVIPEKKVVTGPANLIIEDVNTPLVLPFGIFSIKRGQSSGIIVPQYGSSFGRGYFLRDGGYYFGLGEKADWRVTGDFFTNTSWALRNGFNYANRYRFRGNLLFNYADNKFGNEEDPTYTRSKDFQFTWAHNSDPKARPNTSFGANVNIVSVNREGNSYLSNNSYNPNNITTNQLTSSISFNKSFKNGRYNFSTNARMSQNTQSRDVSVSFPDFTFTVASFAPLKPKRKPTADKWYENITTQYTVVFRNDVNTKDSILFKGRSGSEWRNFLDTASRYGMKHDIPIQTSFKVFKFYTLGAGVNVSEVWYMQTIEKQVDPLTNQVITKRVNGFDRALTYSPSVNLNTRWYGMKQFEKGKIRAIRHVVSPTLGYSYTPDFSEGQYGYYRTIRDTAGKEINYSRFEQGIFGGPGSGRFGNINFSIDNNIELKMMQGKDTARKETKVQIFESIRAAGSYNTFADSLNLSVINLSARTRLFKNVQLNMQANLDPYKNEEIVTANGFKSITRVNKFYLNETNSLGVITNADIGLSANFSPETFKPKNTNKKAYEGELRYMNDHPEDYYDFNVPWSLSLNYTVRYNRYNNLNDSKLSNYIQTLNFSGDVNLTKNWKVGYSSGYDIQNKELTFTSIDFIRQLHCWEFKLNWIPVGFRQSFLFTINVKSSLLQDLRMTRRRDWFDRRI